MRRLRNGGKKKDFLSRSWKVEGELVGYAKGRVGFRWGMAGSRGGLRRRGRERKSRRNRDSKKSGKSEGS